MLPVANLLPSMPIIVSGQEGDWVGWPCWLKGLIPMPMSAEPPETPKWDIYTHIVSPNLQAIQLEHNRQDMQHVALNAR